MASIPSVQNAALVSESQSTPPPITTCAEINTSVLATPPTPVRSLARFFSSSLIIAHSVSYSVNIPAHIESQTHPSATKCFPIFSSGNVFIKCNLVTPPMKWQLHSAILARHSSWFRDAQQLGAHHSNYFHTWLFLLLEELDGCLKLVLHKATPIKTENDVQTPDSALEDHLPADTIPTSPASISYTSAISDSLTSSSQPRPTIQTYSQILSSFYSLPLALPFATLPSTLSAAESFLKVAHSLSCTPIIATQISTVLHYHRRTLYTSIARDPARYLLLSILLRNKAIYTESLIHIDGAHPCWPWPTKRDVLPDAIMRVVKRKSKKLDDLVTEVERELLLATITVHRNRPVDPQTPSEFDTWFIVHLFRDTLARTFTSLSNPTPPHSIAAQRFARSARVGLRG